MNYFTADSHFSMIDNTVISRDFRPFTSLAQMNQYIIDKWNEEAKETDTIYHLGDFANYNGLDNEKFKEYFALVKQINAKVVLILGNNERKVLFREFGGDFSSFRDFLIDVGFHDVIEKSMELKIGKHIYTLTHKPTDASKCGKYTLFGHIHKACLVKRFGFNVGVDNHYFKLFSENEISELEDRRIYFDEDVYI